MFSVVIPTLWKSDRIFKSLDNLENCPLITEIILINNTPGHNPDLNKYQKINLINPKENLYVNPSWNLGVELAKNDLVCLLSDDVNFLVDTLFYFVYNTSNLLGVFGVNPISLSTTPALTIGHNIGYNWGCVLFIKKSNFLPIPSQLKIWYGDNWLCHINNTSSYTIHFNMNFDSEVTSSSLEFKQIIQQDINEWKKLKI